MSEMMKKALDTIAPKKTFIVKANYIHGISEDTKNSMRLRDQARYEVRRWLEYGLHRAYIDN